MTENGMDFQTDLAPVSGFGDGSHPGEAIDPPAMDLEEGAQFLPAAEHGDGTAHEPGSHFSTQHFLSLDLTTSFDGNGGCKVPVVNTARTREIASPESHLRDPKTSGSMVGVEFDLQVASDVSVCPEVRKDSARATGDGEGSSTPESDRSWTDGLKPPLHVISDITEVQLRASNSASSMELEEQPESGLHVVAGEWHERTEGDHIQIQELLTRLQTLNPSFCDEPLNEEHVPCMSEIVRLTAADLEEEEAGEYNGVQAQDFEPHGLQSEDSPCPLHIATGKGIVIQARCDQLSQDSAVTQQNPRSQGLLVAEADREDLLDLLRYERVPSSEAMAGTPLARSDIVTGAKLEMVTSVQNPSEDGDDRDALEMIAPQRHSPDLASGHGTSDSGSLSAETEGSQEWHLVRDEPPCPLGASKEASTYLCPRCPDDSPECAWLRMPSALAVEEQQSPRSCDGSNMVETLASYSTIKEVPGPCEPEDLLDGVIFGAKYLGSTQLVSEKSPSTSIRMAQAQEAVDRIKAPAGESQPMTEVDLFVSTQRIKVLTADTQETMMDHPLQTISYIADIDNIIVFMARRKLPRHAEEATGEKRMYKMICHVFQSTDAQMIAQAIGQAFGVAYQQFLQSSGIDPSKLLPSQYSNILEQEQLYNADLDHFSKQENCKDVCIRKQKGEILGIAVVESGWGSILPTVTIANLMHGGPAEKSGELSIGDRLMSVNGTSLVGLPLATCQGIIRDLKPLTEVTLSIVHCPPVTTAIIRRTDAKHQLGFCVEDGIICSLMRGGIAERGGIRVGHRIIEINGQSVVATPHEKIIQTLMNAVGEVHIKTMPASTYRLLTGQEQPIYL
ncbi:amyloid-beta A4 precursor protein-binding family A member 3 [Microcaecilia unicolor]|uniref:Amyloid-beta A4 precursor protein-binding family A member 3 n=1 Tax=Microcaecilia unicolor TaxID=1415580 RepID=A0A6P7ZEG2_9AMPH|nr:amyloid-beta A4 precursor protein-binding family A member 3 [Microcaecilia unicolor]